MYEIAYYSSNHWSISDHWNTKLISSYHLHILPFL